MTETTLPRVAFNRREAAKILGVSVDTIRRAKSAGQLKAKSTSHDKDGNATGNDLYTLADLQAWYDGLGEA